MKVLLVYSSKTGFTERYANWIKEELNCDIGELKTISRETLARYETVIYGGGIYAGKINGLAKFKNLLQRPHRQGQKIIVYATGAAPAEAKGTVENVIKNNISEQDRGAIPVFYFQSGLNYERMGLVSKFMMKILPHILKRKKDKTPEDEAMVEAIKQSFDSTDKKYIQPLLDHVRTA